jgi:uncharacterized protein (TIGR02271 family)
MAYESPNSAGGVGTTAQVVVGLFKNASDAHRAVTQLRAQAFEPSQIGAAFRSLQRAPYLDPSDAGAVPSGTVHHEQENWWEKLKDAFRSGDSVERRRETRHAAADTSFEDGAYSRADYEYDLENDDFQGSLAGTGIPSDRAAYLTESLEPGGAIVTVHDANRTREAEDILAANHAQVRYEDIGLDAADAEIDAADSTGREIYDTGHVDRRPVSVERLNATDAELTDEGRMGAEDSTGREITASGYVGERPANAETRPMDRVQLFGEVLRVHKERISRGEVRVRKDVITENQTIEVPVMREELVLERVQVSGETPASSANIGGSQEIRIPLSEEKVRVEKQAVVREEVNVGKREVAGVETVNADVRREELRVDPDPETPKRSASGEELPGEVRRHG